MISILFASIILAYGTINAGKYLHHHLLHCLFGAPQTFFDTVPKGRVLSRFSSDLNTVDTSLPQNLKQTIYTLLRVGFLFFIYFLLLSL